MNSSPLTAVFSLLHALLPPSKSFQFSLCFILFSLFQGQRCYYTKLDQFTITLVCLPASSLFPCPTHPTSHHWAIFLKLHVFIMLAPWIRTSKDFPLSTQFSLVFQSPSPSASALIPTASPATTPLRERPPSNSPLRCCPLKVCYTEILSGHSDGKGGKRTPKSHERGWAGKEQPFLGLKIHQMSLLCKWAESRDASLSDWEGEFRGVLRWGRSWKQILLLAKAGTGLRHTAPLPTGSREGKSGVSSAANPELRMKTDPSITTLTHREWMHFRQTSQMQLEGHVLWEAFSDLMSCLYDLPWAPFPFHSDLNQSSELTEGSSLFSHLSLPLPRELVTQCLVCGAAQ